MLKEAFTSDLFPTEQKIRLSENSAAWPETINSMLIRKYPELTRYIDKITFSHLDKIKGHAIGYVTVINNMFRIPFVVDKFTLNPLDIYIKGNVFGYLTSQSVKRLVSNSWPFKQVAKNDFIGMKKFAAVQMTDMTVEQIEQDPTLLKLAAELAESYPEVIFNLSANIQNTQMLKQAGFNPYGQEKVASLEISKDKTSITLHHFGKADEALSLAETSHRFGIDKVAEVLEKGHVTTVLRDIMYKTAAELNPGQFKFDNSLPRTVNLADGIGGFVRGNIYELRDIKNPSAKRGHIFLSTRSKDPYYTTIMTPPAKDRIYSIAERATLGDILDDLSRSSGGKGQAIGILMGDIVYGPFEVMAEAQNGPTHILSIKDGYEYDSKRIHITNNIKSIVVEDDEIYVPTFAKVIALGEPYQMEHPLHKTAAVTVTIAATPDRRGFNITDCGVSGLPSASLQNLKKTKAITALMHCGLSEEEAKSAVQTAITSGVHKFSATPTATQSEDQTRSEVESVNDKKKLEKTASVIRNIVDKSDLVKLAMSYGDEESVDMALSLKLVTPTSIKKYRLLIPKIEDTLDGLCKLVMAKRVGGNIIPIEEGKIVAAIAALSEIMFELTGI
jgi:hypothetical protein